MFNWPFLLIFCFTYVTARSTRGAQPSRRSLDSRAITTLNWKSFVIEDCGPDGPEVIEALQAATAVMNAAILDTAFGTASTHGFSAFFKTSNNADYVAGLLTKMAQGALVEPWVSHKPELDPTSPTPPTLICPNEGMILDDAGDTSDPGPYETCQGPNLAAFTDVVYNAIFLCDHFFTWTTSPRTRNCPAVDTVNNEFRANDFQSSGFTDYQSYVLVHELVHLYSAGEDLNAGTEPPEKYDLNECVSLPAELSIYNPENYVLYVAAIEQQCTAFPVPSVTMALSSTAPAATATVTATLNPTLNPLQHCGAHIECGY